MLETFRSIENHNRGLAYENTWEHLAPKKNVTYRSKLLFAVSEYSGEGRTIIRDGLPNSPWMYEGINQFICSFEDLEPGVYEVDVTFRNFRFWGQPKLVFY